MDERVERMEEGGEAGAAEVAAVDEAGQTVRPFTNSLTKQGMVY